MSASEPLNAIVTSSPRVSGSQELGERLKVEKPDITQDVATLVTASVFLIGVIAGLMGAVSREEIEVAMKADQGTYNVPYDMMLFLMSILTLVGSGYVILSAVILALTLSAFDIMNSDSINATIWYNYFKNEIRICYILILLPLLSTSAACGEVMFIKCGSNSNRDIILYTGYVGYGSYILLFIWNVVKVFRIKHQFKTRGTDSFIHSEALSPSSRLPTSNSSVSYPTTPLRQFLPCMNQISPLGNDNLSD